MTPAETIGPVAEAGSTRAHDVLRPRRRFPSRFQAIRLFIKLDLASLARSWLCRGFLIVSTVITLLELKGMQAKQQPASQMLEAVYVTYLVVWMHVVILDRKSTRLNSSH